MIKPLSINDIGQLREGDTVGLRLQPGVIVKGHVLGDVTVRMLRSNYVPHKREAKKGARSTKGRFVGHEFVVAVEYTHPGLGRRALHVTPMRRDMLVKGV